MDNINIFVDKFMYKNVFQHLKTTSDVHVLSFVCLFGVSN